MGRKERGSGENESPVYYRQYLKKKKKVLMRIPAYQEKLIEFSKRAPVCDTLH